MNLQVSKDWAGLRRLCEILRSPEGCSWDKAQSVTSVTPYLLEETHEVLEAIASRDPERMTEELGDLLYLHVFICTMAKEESLFSLDDVISGIIAKLVRRHPHIFSDSRQSLDNEATNEQWEKIKSQERKSHRKKTDRLAGGAESLPALLDAFRVQGKAASFGFDWPKVSQVRDKLSEEIGELDEAIEIYDNRKAVDRESGDRPAQGAEDRELADVHEELGDILFTVVNLARHFNADPEQLLKSCTRKFKHRFGLMEKLLDASGSSLAGADLDTMEAAWQKAKSIPGDETATPQ